MIVKAKIEDSAVLAALAKKLWHSHTLPELEAEFRELLESAEAVCFIKYSDDKPVGFSQCQLRYDYVEGTHSSPVGYLEGIFVLPEYRKKGIAGELLASCEKWAKEKGCREFASDCEIHNTDSLNFHKALGFDEVNRIICFKKDL